LGGRETGLWSLSTAPPFHINRAFQSAIIPPCQHLKSTQKLVFQRRRVHGRPALREAVVDGGPFRIVRFRRRAKRAASASLARKLRWTLAVTQTELLKAAQRSLLDSALAGVVEKGPTVPRMQAPTRSARARAEEIYGRENATDVVRASQSVF
jgi:hypothetical protein